MQKIKGRSSRMLQQEFPHLKKRYWGQHIWARGYFCTTVGQVTDQMIRDCIEGLWENPRTTPLQWMRIDPRLQWASAFVVDFSLVLDFQSVI